MTLGRSRARTLAAAFLAVTWVVVPVVGALHGATSAHTYCLEHGRFEESAPASTGDTAALELLRIAASTTAEDDHDACGFSQVVPCSAAGSAGPAGHAVPPALEAPAPLISSTAGLPIPVLALAPKSSPPARA